MTEAHVATLRRLPIFRVGLPLAGAPDAAGPWAAGGDGGLPIPAHASADLQALPEAPGAQLRDAADGSRDAAAPAGEAAADTVDPGTPRREAAGFADLPGRSYVAPLGTPSELLSPVRAAAEPRILNSLDFTWAFFKRFAYCP